MKPAALPYRALALDLDGTLLDGEGRLSPASIRALRSLSARGVRVALASGRMPARIVPFVDELEIPAAIIAFNGAELLERRGRKWEPIYARAIGSRTRDAVFDLCSRNGIYLNVYMGGELHGFHAAGDHAFSSHYENHTSAKYAGKWNKLEDLPQENISKLLIIETPRRRDQLFAQVEESFSTHCRVLKSCPEYLEFVDLGISKAAALEFWLEKNGIAAGELLAFGDAENDFEMLTLAGQGIAMANATPGLRALCPRLSPWMHDQDGVARALASIFAP